MGKDAIPRLPMKYCKKNPMISRKVKFDHPTLANQEETIREPAPYPKDAASRGFIQPRFGKVDRNRLNQVDPWYQDFQKTAQGSKMDDVVMHTLWATASDRRRRELKSLGYKLIGLSALSSSSEITVPGLLPLSMEVPPPGSLMRITSSKQKIIHHDMKSNIGTKYLVIEDWDYEDHRHLYDLDYEKGITLKLIREYLINEYDIAYSLSGPLIGAPKYSDIGGIASNSFGTSTLFTRELTNLIQMITPPIFRRYHLPKSWERGRKLDVGDTIKMKFSHYHQTTDIIVDSLSSSEYPEIDSILMNRGDQSSHSVFSTLTHPKGLPAKAMNQFIMNYSKAELYIPEGLDKLPMADVDITKMIKAMNEDVWIELVALERRKPKIPPSIMSTLQDRGNRAVEHISILLEEEIGMDDDSIPRLVLAPVVGNIQDNMIRVASLNARMDESEEIDEDHIIQAERKTKKDFEKQITSTITESLLLDFKKSTKYLNSDMSVFQKRHYEDAIGFLRDNPNSTIAEICDHFHCTPDDKVGIKIENMIRYMRYQRWISYNRMDGTYRSNI